MKFLNLTLDYTKDFGSANGSLSDDGALFLYVTPSQDVHQAYLNFGVKFSTDGSDNFQNSFLNKTINFCKLLSEPRYEPLIALGYKIVLKMQNTQLPERCPLKKVKEICELSKVFYSER